MKCNLKKLKGVKSADTINTYIKTYCNKILYDHDELKPDHVKK